MILIKVGSVSFTLPLSDEALYRMDPENKLDLFLPLARAQFETADMNAAFHQALEEITSNTLDEAHPELNRPSM